MGSLFGFELNVVFVRRNGVGVSMAGQKKVSICLVFFVSVGGLSHRRCEQGS